MAHSTPDTKEPYVGKELGSVNFPVTESVLNDYYSGLDLPRPAPAGRTISVPSMIASGPDNAYFEQSSFSNHFGHLWMRQEWELFEPLVLGQDYTATAQISDIYQKRNQPTPLSSPPSICTLRCRMTPSTQVVPAVWV